MKRVTGVISALLICLISFSAYAADTNMYTDSISSDNNRLFDVPIYIKSSKILTAAAFTLKYDTSKIAFRNVSATVSGATVKYAENNGKLKLIFLCANGVKVNKKSLIARVKFKTVAAEGSIISITASDFVNYKAVNFTPPASVNSEITVNGKSPSTSSVKPRDSLTSSKTTVNGKTSSVSGRAATGETVANGDDSENPDDEDKGLISEINAMAKSGKTPWIFIICMAVLSAGAAAFLMYLIQRRNKRDEKDKK